MSVKQYGELEIESDAESMLQCRQIVKTINQFGITEEQRLKLIYLLALDLENREYMQELTGLIKRLEAGERRSTLITDV